MVIIVNNVREWLIYFYVSLLVCWFLRCAVWVRSKAERESGKVFSASARAFAVHRAQLFISELSIVVVSAKEKPRRASYLWKVIKHLLIQQIVCKLLYCTFDDTRVIKMLHTIFTFDLRTGETMTNWWSFNYSRNIQTRCWLHLLVAFIRLKLLPISL